MSSESLHESPELISEATKNMHRAIVTLIEELEAVDWYQQRADACSDAALRDVIIHNKNEEIEHATMTLEWFRRHSPELDNQLRHLSVLGRADRRHRGRRSGRGRRRGQEPGSTVPAPAHRSLGIGSLKEEG